MSNLAEQQDNEFEGADLEASSDVEVEVIDDTPEDDRNRSRLSDEDLQESPEIPDDELKNYSDGVQKRISQLTHRMHEERRRKEEAERMRDEAVRYAKEQHEKSSKLQQYVAKGETALVQQAKTRVEAELERVKASYKEAYDTGDSDALFAAQQRLSELTAEKNKFEKFRPRQAQPEKFKFGQEAPAGQQEPLKPDPQAEDWAQRNPWFGPNKAMTGYAYGLHEELVMSGVDPRSAEYYEQLDSRIREAFPHEFGGSQRQGSVVAPAGRSSKSPRKVKLTQSQVALAKRLGISPEAYAAQMMKEITK